jgi:quercetin dioxygenase-like cupin family protein
MSMEVRRFGAGTRRPDGPPGTSGVEGNVIHSDARGVVAELAFAPKGTIVPHDNPNTTWFIVIEGAGYVIVGDERRAVAAGDAVLWPAGVTHGAFTTRSPMRAIVVEFAGDSDAHLRGILAGTARRLLAGEAGRVPRGEGSLAPRPRPDGGSPAHDEGEPE